MLFFSWFLKDNHYLSLLGILAILGVAFLVSNNRRLIKLRFVLTALFMQAVLALFILKTGLGKIVFKSIARGVEQVYQFADQGTIFVFGSLARTDGPWGVVFAVKVLPVIVFFGALMAMLFHFGIIQVIVKSVAFVIRPLFGTSGAETLTVAANSMLGQTEAPLLVKKYIASMTDSEMLTVMVSGMASLSGAILAVYGLMGVPILHLISASIIGIPGSILISKMLLPETKVPETLDSKSVKMESDTKNVLDAISTGTTDGLRLAVNVAAMLIAFISLMALADAVLLYTTGLTLNSFFAHLFYGVAYMIGIPSQDCSAAGALLGQKLVINEFVAYSSMVKMKLSARSVAILTYAIAGFSNFSCIGIQIGGIGALCPSKRSTLTRLGFRALLGGTLTNLLNAALISLLL